MDGGGLVFNTTYKSLAAEWLGLSRNQELKKDEISTDDDDHPVIKSKQDHVHTGQQKNKHEHKHTEKIKPSLEVGEKLQRKLFKAKKRAHERDKDNVNPKFMKSGNESDDEESKVDVVKKKSRLELQKDETKPKSLTMADIKKKLKDQTLSKPARKRLRRKLKNLEEKEKPSTHAAPANHQKSKWKDRVQITNMNKKSPVQSEAKLKRKEINDFSKSFTSETNISSSKKKKKLDNAISKKKSKQKQNLVNSSDGDTSSESDTETNDKTNTSTSQNIFSNKKSTAGDIRTSPSKKKRNRKKSSFCDVKNLQSNAENKSKKMFKNKVNGKTNSAGTGNKNSVEVSDHADDGKVTLKKKRKRPKSRSKQKNIRKDHRPNEMKPAHLQGAGMQRVSTKIMSRKEEDSDS